MSSLRFLIATGVTMLTACTSGAVAPEAAPQTPPAEASKATQPGQASADLATLGTTIVERILELETRRDVTCWTSFRQLDSFVSSKSYSDFATLSKIEAAKALVGEVWRRASQTEPGATITTRSLRAIVSVEADLPAARRAELEAFADDLGMQQFRDYRTTSEHWRVLLSVLAQTLDQSAPELKPLEPAALDELALIATKLGLSLLVESGSIATAARSPLIEADHVRLAYRNLADKYELHPPKDSAPQPATGRGRGAQVRLSGQLIAAKVNALRKYNGSSADLTAELNKISTIPVEASGAAKMLTELRAMARFFAMGYEPMRADNYLADGNFAPTRLAGKRFIDAAYIENATAQVFPYVMLPNGDVKLRFEVRPGQVTSRTLQAQDVTLLDHHMNAVRDTALHWVLLREIFAADPFAIDPFAAEYLSELTSIVATYYLRRAQTVARQTGSETITADHIAAVRDPGYVMVAPEAKQAQPKWAEAQHRKKAAILSEYEGPLFSDVTAAYGLPTQLEGVATASVGSSSFDIQTAMGAGIALGDVNGDGYPDVYLAGAGRGRLYLNRAGARFEDSTAGWGLPPSLPDGRGALLWDFDGDADLDLLVLRSRHPASLFENLGESFRDVAASRGVVTGSGAHVATALDYDADGDLDLYVGYYGADACNAGACRGRNLPSMDGRNGTPNQLFRNDGDRFTEVGQQAGVDDRGWTLAVGSFDYDSDGDADLYLANDFGSNPLLRNEGDGTFVNVAENLGADDRGSGMNVSFADLDGDDAFDVFVSNVDMFSKNVKVVFPRDQSLLNLSDRVLRSFQYLSGNKLYFNKADTQGNRRFEAQEQEWFEPGDRGWGWAALFFDYENDGDEDFYLANGWIPRSPASDQRNQLFLRDDKTFYQVDRQTEPAAFAGNSRSAINFDFDRDGDLDVLVNNYARAPVLLRNEQTTPNRWIGVRLRGSGPNSRAVGAIVELSAGALRARRLVTAGEGYLGQRDEVLHFGLGTADRANVTVHWPNAAPQTLSRLAAGKIHEILQPN